ncbi:hypothetical protein ACSFXN_18175 [Planococcus sp. 1R117A]|uniref:hypothetical protein n=1 Tax=Planococcus sp. 1R117A TaxID=3447020 RepID=UPI003EDB7163
MVGNIVETPEKLRKTILLLAKEALLKNIRETNRKIESLACEHSRSKSCFPGDTKLHARTLQELNQQHSNRTYWENVLLELEKWKKE